MQRMGTEVVRDLFGENVWIDHLASRITHKKVVVADVRYDNEAKWVRNMGGTVMQLRRDGLAKGFGSEHSSELGISSEYVSGTIQNNGVSLEELRHAAFEAIAKTEESE